MNTHSLFHNLQIIFVLLVIKNVKLDSEISCAENLEQSYHLCCQSWGTVGGIRCAYRVGYGIICFSMVAFISLKKIAWCCSEVAVDIFLLSNMSALFSV